MKVNFWIIFGTEEEMLSDEEYAFPSKELKAFYFNRRREISNIHR